MFVSQQATLALIGGATGTAKAGNSGFGADASATLGIGASLEALKVCAIIVINQDTTSECCQSEGNRLTDTPWQ